MKHWEEEHGNKRHLEVADANTQHSAKHDPNDPTSYRPSVAASSVYSQPDDNISPPASPYRRPVDDDGRISPIDEHSPSGYGDLPRANKSQIPVARKITPRSKEWTQNVGKGAPMMYVDEGYIGKSQLAMLGGDVMRAHFGLTLLAGRFVSSGSMHKDAKLMDNLPFIMVEMSELSF
jgi:hypothetical protein